MELNKKLNALLAFMITVFIGAGVFSGTAYGETDGKKVYMVVANKLLLEDIDKMENLKAMSDEASLGLMNVRGASSYNDIESFLTINASSKAYGIATMGKMVNLYDENRDLYETRMGELDEKYEVGNIEFNRLKLFNEDRTYSPVIGALGENMKRSGKKRAVYGNSDGEEEQRFGSLIAMDFRGLVEYGDVENMNKEDGRAPFGVRTDYEKIMSSIEEHEDEVDFTVVDAGDLDRLSDYGLYLDDEMFQYHRNKALADLDEFIKELKGFAGEDSMIIVISPNEGEMRIVENKLSPLVIWTDDMEAGTLTSGSTRVDGIVTNMDVAPTISDYMGISAENYVGSKIEHIEASDRAELLTGLSEQNNFLMRARSALLNYYAIFLIATILISGLSMLLFKEMPRKLKTVVGNTSIFIAAVPLALLLVPPLKLTNTAILAAVAVGLAALIAFVTRKMEGKKRLVLIMAATATAILLDTLTGSYLARNSVMGYSPIMGARYFGIGNELAGVLLSSVAITSGYMIQKYRVKALVLIPFICLFVMISPRLGANVGGSISFAVMALTMSLLVSGKKVNFKTVALLGVILAGGVVVVGIADATISDSPAHLGKLFLDVKENGISSFADIVFRKVSVNIRLMGSSVWSRALIATTVVMSLLLVSLGSVYNSVFKREVYIAHALIAVVIGSVAGLLANDSGVLLASFANIYTSIAVMQIGFYEKKKES